MALIDKEVLKAQLNNSICGYCDDCGDKCESCKISVVFETLEAFPERKTGKWIDHSEDGYVECPVCGHLTTCEGVIEDLHYCFWCGLRMEVNQ